MMLEPLSSRSHGMDPVLQVARGQHGDYDRPALAPRHEFDHEYVSRLTAGDPDVEEHFTRYFGDLLSLKLRLAAAFAGGHPRRQARRRFVRRSTTLKKKGGLATPESLGSFVNSVCNNVLFEIVPHAVARHSARKPSRPGRRTRTTVEASMVREQEDRRVREIVAALPQREQDLLRWLFFDERAKDDVCERLNIDRNYLRVLLHRAKTRFRAALAQTELEGV